MRIFLLHGGQFPALVEVNEFRSINDLKASVADVLSQVSSTPSGASASFDLWIEGRPLREHQLTSVEDGCCMEIVPSNGVTERACTQLEELGRDVTVPAFVSAVQHGEADVCSLYCNAGVASPRIASSLLHDAAGCGFVTTCQSLLRHGANVNESHGCTPLHRAAQNQRLAVCRVLVEAGASVHAVDKGRQTPLHAAAFYGHADVARYLLDNHADPDARDLFAQVPLHLAACGGHVKVMEVLLEKGASVNLRTKMKRTALHLASSNCRRAAEELLLAHGARPEVGCCVVS